MLTVENSNRPMHRHSLLTPHPDSTQLCRCFRTSCNPIPAALDPSTVLTEENLRQL